MEKRRGGRGEGGGFEKIIKRNRLLNQNAGEKEDERAWYIKKERKGRRDDGAVD